MSCTFDNGAFVCGESAESDVHGTNGTHDYEVKDAWRERDEILGDFDQAIESVDGDDGSDFSEVGRCELAVKRLELEIAIGTRDSIADLVEEMRDLTKVVRTFVDRESRVTLT